MRYCTSGYASAASSVAAPPATSVARSAMLRSLGDDEPGDRGLHEQQDRDADVERHEQRDHERGEHAGREPDDAIERQRRQRARTPRPERARTLIAVTSIASLTTHAATTIAPRFTSCTRERAGRASSACTWCENKPGEHGGDREQREVRRRAMRHRVGERGAHRLRPRASPARRRAISTPPPSPPMPADACRIPGERRHAHGEGRASRLR